MVLSSIMRTISIRIENVYPIIVVVIDTSRLLSYKEARLGKCVTDGKLRSKIFAAARLKNQLYKWEVYKMMSESDASISLSIPVRFVTQDEH